MLRFTSEFGKGSGGSTTLLSSGKLAWVGVGLMGDCCPALPVIAVCLVSSDRDNPKLIGETFCSNTPQVDLACVSLGPQPNQSLVTISVVWSSRTGN